MSKTPKTPASAARLTDLEARQAELEKRIADLERAATRQLPAPWTPTGPYPSLPPVLPTPQDDINDARCHVCNNRFKDMTHYVCNHPCCPNRVWCGDTTQPVFTCGGPSSSATVDTLTLPKPGVGPYGAPGTVSIHAVSQTPQGNTQ